MNNLSMASAQAQVAQPDMERLLAQLPYGVALVDEQGLVAPVNDSAVSLLGSRGESGEACSDLLDCKRPNGPCEHGCLAVRARVTGEALPEIRVDTRAAGAAPAVWLTATPGGGGPCLFHLRAAQAGDRRRRSDPHWLGTPQLRICVLGRTKLATREGPLSGTWLGQRPGELLKYLVCNRNRVASADELAEALCRDAGGRGTGRIRYHVHILRNALATSAAAGDPTSFIVTAGEGYAINRRSVVIDADEFEERVEAGRGALARGEIEAAEPLLNDALALYSGDLLEDEPYADWAFHERERLRGLLERVRRDLVVTAMARGDLDTASRQLEALAAAEPLDSQIQRELLSVKIGLGRRSEAMRRYSVFRRQLGQEFREEPDFTLDELTPERARFNQLTAAHAHR